MFWTEQDLASQGDISAHEIIDIKCFPIVQKIDRVDPGYGFGIEFFKG